MPEHHITLHDNGFFFYDEPDRNVIKLNDIVMGLRQPRYTAQTPQLYTIAQHGVFVAEILEDWGCDAYTVYMGLHHDDHEAVFGDFPSPAQWWLKDLLQPFLKPEHAGFDLIKLAKYKLDEQIMPAMGISWPPQEGLWDLVKRADRSALVCEAGQLFSVRPAWLDTWDCRVVDKRIKVMAPWEAVDAFLGKHHSVALACGISL